MTSDDARIAPLGDGALRLELPSEVDPPLLLERLRALPGVTDALVTEAHAAIYFDPSAPAAPDWTALLDACRERGDRRAARQVTLRVRYDGPDLDEAAARLGLAPPEVVAIHAAGDYVVRMIGFLPGFAYLGPLDARLALPRRDTPRPRVPAGALAIAGRTTGIYPFASPGGWHLLGITIDFVPFDRARGAALRLGDRVRFEAVG